MTVACYGALEIVGVIIIIIKVRCHLLGTGSGVLLLNEEFLHSVIYLGCFGKVYPTLEVIIDPCNEL